MSPRSRKGNLPVDLTSFVGRGRELAQVRRLLWAGRLVTLTGVGGVGKSRLAAQVGWRVQRMFPDGVWRVELAGLDDPESLAPMVAAVLGVGEQSTRPVTELLVNYLRDKRLLLVLDNCERLAATTALLVGRLLTWAPGLRVLVTSRQPLRVHGECVLSVAPLSIPDARWAPASTELTSFEAVQLFLERARAVVPTFEVDDRNRDLVARLCQRLDGIPLAIELAAVRLRALSVGQVLDRLDDRFRLLSGGAVTAAARHRTLRATLDWSHSLCSVAERTLWARLSVFAGGFDLEAVEQVCSGSDMELAQVLDVLVGLLDKSVLEREPGSGTPARYRLLETVRQYGREQLAADGEQAVRRRHRDYYRELARRGEAEFFSARQVEWMQRLHRDWPNLRLALEFSLGEPDGAAALEIAVSLRPFWLDTSEHREGLRWLLRALAVDPHPTPLRVAALSTAGYLAAAVGDEQASGRMLAEARTLAGEFDDPHLSARVTFDTAVAATVVQPADLDRGWHLAERALAAFRVAGDTGRVIAALRHLGMLGAVTGHPAAADHVAEHLALCDRLGARWSKSWGLVTLALLRWHRGERAAVAPLLHEALHTKQLLHDPWGTGVCLLLLACVAAEAGQPEHAARLLGAGHAVGRLDGPSLADHGMYVRYRGECEQRVRAALGEEGYASVVAEGARLTHDEAIVYALGPDADPTGRPAPVLDGGPLTRRERQVAGLVAEGLTNREIANRLAIAQRTVESHLEHILTKLGFTSRAQIAAWITERAVRQDQASGQGGRTLSQPHAGIQLMACRCPGARSQARQDADERR